MKVQFIEGNHRPLAEQILQYYPDTQVIYLFGSYGTEVERPDSDVDLALLLPHHLAVQNRSLTLTPAWSHLQTFLGREVDLVNLRLVSTVFQNEVVNTGRVIFEADQEERRVFEMETLSAYQKLTEERKDILTSFFQNKRAYNV